jgi:hypothetical protein
VKNNNFEALLVSRTVIKIHFAGQQPKYLPTLSRLLGLDSRHTSTSILRLRIPKPDQFLSRVQSLHTQRPERFVRPKGRVKAGSPY